MDRHGPSRSVQNGLFALIIIIIIIQKTSTVALRAALNALGQIIGDHKSELQVSEKTTISQNLSNLMHETRIDTKNYTINFITSHLLTYTTQNKWIRFDYVMDAWWHLAIGHIHSQRSSVEIRSVELGDGVLCALLVGELAEAEALRTTRLAIDDDTATGWGINGELSCLLYKEFRFCPTHWIGLIK